jgi:hypothetical protein
MRLFVLGRGQATKAICICQIFSAQPLAQAEAIHPAYGFLSENTSFSEISAEMKITFIGPPEHAMSIRGNKVSARTAMVQAGLPVLPETPVRRTVSAALEATQQIGFPLMLKTAVNVVYTLSAHNKSSRKLFCWPNMKLVKLLRTMEFISGECTPHRNPDPDRSFHSWNPSGRTQLFMSEAQSECT